MARMSRLAIAGYPHHIIQRGNNRARIFEDPEDCERYRALLGDAALQCGVAIHAYVLMDNHVHLLATPASTEGLSRMMQMLGRNYVGWFNRKHGRSGTLWEGRFRSSLIETDRYLLACMRYIELNPVRAGLCGEAAAFPWSSARHHLGQANDPLVTDHALYWSLGNTPFEREAAYRELLSQTVDPQENRRITEACVRSWALGSGEFLERLKPGSGRRLRPKRRGRPFKKDSVPI
jgi:putative transposase